MRATAVACARLTGRAVACARLTGRAVTCARGTAAAADARGMAMVEFALVLPLLLIAALFGLETANLTIAHMRVSRLTSMTADNAARVRDSIDEADVNELMAGAQLASGTLDIATNGRIIVTDLQPNTAGQNGASTGQWLRWQRCYGGLGGQSTYGLAGAGKTDASVQAMGPAGRQIAAAAGTTVMFVEMRYSYKPLVALFGTPQTIRYTSAFNVRSRPQGDPTNAGNLTASQIASC